MSFDPNKPYSRCYGTGKAKFYQNGKSYDGRGNELPPTIKAKPPADDFDESQARSDELAKNDQQPKEGVSVDDLMALKTFTVKSMFLEAGGDPELAKGKGAKQRMVDWLLANA